MVVLPGSLSPRLPLPVWGGWGRGGVAVSLCFRGINPAGHPSLDADSPELGVCLRHRPQRRDKGPSSLDALSPSHLGG